jgi:ADP-ribosylglycohydrolase
LESIIGTGKESEIFDLYQIDDEKSNGNGSLMRILSLYWLLKNGGELEAQFKTIWQVSALTHTHRRAALACLCYLILLEELAIRVSIAEAFRSMQRRMRQFLRSDQSHAAEIPHFQKILREDFGNLPPDDIRSDGYVMHCLEASCWCILTTRSYSEAVLQAVNLGADTDTTAAVAGGLAGWFYGLDQIPGDWLGEIVRLPDIIELCNRFEMVYG